jgi:hypothetical protein
VTVETLSYIATAYAAVVATAALALEVRRWIESGPRLSLSLMAPGIVVGGDDDREFIFATVANRGSMATTITHYGFLEFASWWRRLRNRSSWSAIVKEPEYGAGPLPFILEPGRRWTGGATLQGELIGRANSGYLYVAIHHSHSARPTLKRVVMSKSKELADEAAT